MSLNLDDSLECLKGIGEKRGKNYKKLGVSSVFDLLNHFPRRYVDLSAPYSIASSPFGELVPIRAVLVSKSSEQRIRKGLSIFKLLAVDHSGELEITIFNAKFQVASLKTETEYIFYGRVEGGFIKRKMSSPEIYPANGNLQILPVYPQTAGITSILIRQNIKQILTEITTITDPIPEKYRNKYNIREINDCYKDIHFPRKIEDAETARTRFVFQELLTLICAMSLIKEKNKIDSNIITENIDLNKFYKSLPFTPTSAQLRCVNESVEDMLGGSTMNRLVQGDVGSGKTLVAAACAFFTVKNSAQVAFMVPTSILAEQHFQTLTQLLQPFKIKVELLTGATKASEKKRIAKELAQGEIDICIGTHALLSDKINYKNLGLVITDEQHRFGVEQRAILSDKSRSSHVLVMSATPIPRTLSLIIYGDLSLSILDEMPPGRKDVDTLVINSKKLKRAYGFIKEHLDKKQQAYMVYPLIEVGEIDTGLKPATEYALRLSETEFKDYRVGLLHGKMKAKEKDEIMKSFKDGNIDLLVSTTVVEVGVDVPNATIMLIENAERFGLSQIHQLRGRVGRGAEKSYCILVSDSQGETARARLSAAKEISDGFKLAEYDLQLRGPGDFLGYRQHGLPLLKIADLADDVGVMDDAKKCAEKILSTDPTLKTPENSLLKNNVILMIENVGSKPN